jgi:hypothetical protein
MMTLDQLLPLIRNNLSCYLDKPLTKELIDSLMEQIIDSIDYSMDAKEQN